MEHDVTPSARGLIRCLQALADEAAYLTMTNTSEAILRAIETCLHETVNGKLQTLENRLADVMH